MISDKGEEMQTERTFNNSMGMLFGPVSLPTFKRFIVSKISYGAVGEMKDILRSYISR